jgi:type IV pilus assembly protein PilC
MPRFAYVSRDSAGQRLTAVAEAPNKHGLVAQLKERGLTVIQVKELAGDAAAKAGDGGRGDRKRPRKKAARAASARRWSEITIGSGAPDTGELAVFWRQFATMIGAGLPIVDALDSIANELEHARLRRTLQRVVANMWEGFNLSQSLGRHPTVFSPMTVALMGAAEESGSLPEVSNQLATYLENRDRLIRKVRAALTYPIFLCGFFLMVMVVATFWIIPKFRDIYSGFNAKLPWITQVVFDLNAFILDNLAWTVAGASAVLLVLALWAQRPSGRRVMHRVSLKLPVFGSLLQRAAVARLCRSLSILLAGGIAINRALEMSEATAGNTVVAEAVMAARTQILEGSKIAPALRLQPVFPKMAVRMVAAGEETGNLSGLLEKTAEFYEARVDAALTTINTLIEPIMISVIGVFVLIFVLALYMPIFKLAGTVRG